MQRSRALPAGETRTVAHDVIVFEDARWPDLLPLIYWRTVGELRCGYGPLIDRLNLLDPPATLTGLWTRPELADVAAERFKLPVNRPLRGPAVLINARWLIPRGARLPDPPAIGLCDDHIAWIRLPDTHPRITPQSLLRDDDALRSLPADWPRLPAPGVLLRYPWDLMHHSIRLLSEDWTGDAGCEGRLDHGAVLLAPENIRIEPGARIFPTAVLNAENGPITIGPDAVIAPHCYIEGPCCIGARSRILPATRIRAGTSIGEVCKIGGEVEGSIFFSFSNKQHDGFVGHSCIAQWCNLGADTVTSDLKNTYGPIRIPRPDRTIDTGLIFAGLFMGDHVKTGINQAFSTGTIVGFGSQIASSALPPRFIPSFTWLTDQGRQACDVERCLTVARRVMARRDRQMSPAEEALFRRIPEIAAIVEHT